MPNVADVLQYVQTLAPKHMAESWDNVGLLCGRKGKPVNKILVALDPFRGVIQEAIDWDADLIITHHPVIFGEITALNEDTQTGRNLLALIEHGIAAINAHTNLDQAPGGVNDLLARALGLADVRVMDPCGTDESGQLWGLLRQGVVNSQSLEDFLPTVKAALGCPALRYVRGGKPVHHVAVGGGACAGGLKDAVNAGCDTFVTSDVKYNQFWDAADLGLNLIDAGHFYTENPVTGYLAEKLMGAFPQVQIRISQTHRDCMEFF